MAITDGTTTKESLSASSPPGEFLVSGLPEGAWSLTFVLDGYVSHTELVVLDPGEDTTITANMSPVSTSAPTP
ncbi:MAG: hypothetical protein U5K29_03240 [Acidimicrobiales bacterium]|nr:hypothetical protein [Acidimicrobiales bacterium]